MKAMKTHFTWQVTQTQRNSGHILCGAKLTQLKNIFRHTHAAIISWNSNKLASGGDVITAILHFTSYIALSSWMVPTAYEASL